MKSAQKVDPGEEHFLLASHLRGLEPVELKFGEREGGGGGCGGHV